MASMAETGSEAEASEVSPADSSEPSEISRTSGMPAPHAEASTSRPPGIFRGR